MRKKIEDASEKEMEKETEAFKSICFVTRADDQRYTKNWTILKVQYIKERIITRK